MEGEEMFHVNNFMSSQIKPSRKRNASSGENSESGAAGQGANEGKWEWYHCNYCNQDITGKIHNKCAVCPDFYLCIKCFTVASEMTPHRNNHPFRVMDPRAAGCRTSAEADRYLANKRRKETLEGSQVGPNNHRVPNALMSPDSAGARPAGPANSISVNEIDVAGQGASEGKGTLIHCNYCNKDITRENRIKCVNFDLCIDCFSVGAEVMHRKSNQPYRVMELLSPGCRISADADRNLPNKRRKETEEGACRPREGFQVGPNNHGVSNALMSPDSAGARPAGPANSIFVNEIDVAGQGASEGKRALIHCNYCYKDISGNIHIKCAICPNLDLCNECFSVRAVLTPHKTNHPYMVMKPHTAVCHTSAEIDVADFLSEPEKRLCVELRMPPAVYLNMQRQLYMQMFVGTVTSKSDAHKLFKMDTAKIDRVYDMLMKK